MTPLEAGLLCRYVSGACPQQRFDEYTPDVWADLLADLPFGVAQAAAREVVQVQPFVAPSEIIRAAKRMRTVTRRAVRQAARESGGLVNVDAAADAAITTRSVRFDGIDLMSPEGQDVQLYRPEVAVLTNWSPAKELGA